MTAFRGAGTALRRMARASIAAAIAVMAAMLSPSVATAADPVHFSASGDFAATAQSNAVLDAIPRLGSQFHIALGDLSYGRVGDEPKWCAATKARVGATFPFQLITGNAESNSANGLIENFAACLPTRLPGVTGTYGRRWYVDVPAGNPVMRIILASPGLTTPDGVKHTYAAGSADYTWLSDTIDAARAKGLPWVVTAVHYPCLTVGEYGCGMGTATMNLLVEKKVDLVLMGHEHHYTRSHQIGTGTGCTTPAQISRSTVNAACVRDRDAQMVKGAGTVFAIVGTGGKTLRPIDVADPEWPYFAAASGSNMTPSWGSLDIKATADGLRASFVPAAGAFHDTFTIGSYSAPGNTPDTDGDSVPDSTDLCPRRSGPTVRRGCPKYIVGTIGVDQLGGSALGDIILGFGGNDTLAGLARPDRINGGRGRDLMLGGVGRDVLTGGDGADTLLGGPDNDLIRARDGAVDTVECGTGRDLAIVDRADITRRCERVLRP